MLTLNIESRKTKSVSSAQRKVFFFISGFFVFLSSPFYALFDPLSKIGRSEHARQITFTGFLPRYSFWQHPRKCVERNKVPLIQDQGYGVMKLLLTPSSIPLRAKQKSVKRVNDGIKSEGLVEKGGGKYVSSLLLSSPSSEDYRPPSSYFPLSWKTTFPQNWPDSAFLFFITEFICHPPFCRPLLDSFRYSQL